MPDRSTMMFCARLPALMAFSGLFLDAVLCMDVSVVAKSGWEVCLNCACPNAECAKDEWSQ